MAARVPEDETLVQISLFLKTVGQRPIPVMQCALASHGHSLIIVNFLGGIAIYHPRRDCPKS